MEKKEFLEKVGLLEQRITELEKPRRLKRVFSKLNIIIGITVTVIISSITLYGARINFEKYSIIKSADVNHNFEEAFGLVPIGTILPWHKHLYDNDKVPLSPSNFGNFVECNGQVLEDSFYEDSPFYGKQIPNLNGDSRFLMGGTESGLEGGSNDGHHHGPGSLSASGGAHQHTVWGWESYNKYYTMHDTSWWGARFVFSQSYEGEGAHGHTFGGRVGNIADGIDGDEEGSNRPSYLTVVWIIRIK